jgi:flavin reductase (DIM6/NTAB) family NADH-FMN oxidoreductase RutF
VVIPELHQSIIDSAVCLVLTELGDRRNAMTISCFSEVAHHPTSLWISVAKSAYTNGLIRESGRFSLAVLNVKQKSIALECGTVSGRVCDKCSSLDLYRSANNFLFLRGALASTACSVRQTLDVGDHTLVIADILHTDLDSRVAHLRHLLLSDLALS